jgi:hypothetical protein
MKKNINENKLDILNNVTLFYFGDHCEPSMLIDFILKIKTKNMFMLGWYLFNDNLNYLEDDNLKDIYSKKYLKVKNYQSSLHEIVHTKYNFLFNHDFKCDEKGNIINYDHIKERFDEKIENFKLLYNNNSKKKIFISFSENITDNDYDKFIDFFDSNTYLLQFTNSNLKPNKKYKNIKIIKLENNYQIWYKLEPLDAPSSIEDIFKYADNPQYPRYKLYKEVYEKFINYVKNL